MSKKNKRIVFIINVDWYFYLHWLDRAEYFKSIGFDIYIITSFRSDETKKEILERGFHCYHFELERNSVNVTKELSSLFQIRKILLDINPSLIHCITIKPNLYAGIINKLFFNKPIIYSVTGLGATFSSLKIKFKIIRFLVIFIYKYISVNNSRFIFENSEDYKIFENSGILKNNGVVIKGAGIDLRLFSQSPPPRNNTVLFAARLLRDKGLHELVEAAVLLRERGIDITVKVAGIIDQDVSSAIPISVVEEWDKNGDIVWLGNVKNMPALIHQCDLVCLPTKYGEGVPRILIEAASCQRPVITTDVPGCRELVEDGVNGLLIKPGSVEALVNGLESLLLQPVKREQLGLEGRRIVEREFAQEIVFDKTFKVYQSLLGL
ncbi:glycosyltransferase family 4 protein [Vibrio fluvialis]|nr:glycosyltransferase family 4 protein [Vibrio fluvialis]MBY8206442.1 glycosyltransferase family 4 protein [Vibrio fluvialis]